MTTEQLSPTRSLVRSRSGLVLLGFLVIAGFFVVTEHRAHLLDVLPWLLVLACPLLHFLHRGHGGGHGRHKGSARPPEGRAR